MNKKPHKHIWEHETEIALSMGKKKCMWLNHKCKKCGLTTDGIFIKEIEKVKK